MPANMTTLLDIVKANKGDREVGLIEEVVPAVPELSIIPMRPIPGINYPTWVRTGLPTVGFRAANSGSALSKSTFEQRLVECFIFTPVIAVDESVANAYIDGPGAWMAIEGVGVTKATMIALAKQMYYGTGGNGDAMGNPGFLQAYDSVNMVVDAGGTTDNTASSVWGVKVGLQDVTFVMGNGGDLSVSDPVKQLMALDSNSPTNLTPCLVSSLQLRPGLQVGNVYSIGRIKKLTEDANKGLTDDLLADLYAKFPVGSKPDHWMMNRRSLAQLQKSRTATNATGAPAPQPTESQGVPIVCTDAILNTETLAL